MRRFRRSEAKSKIWRRPSDQRERSTYAVLSDRSRAFHKSYLILKNKP